MLATLKGKNRAALILILICLSLILPDASVFASTELNNLRAAIAAKGAQWEAGDTSISVLPKEQRKKRLGVDIPALHAANASAPVVASPSVNGLAAISSSLDWRNSNVVTAVRDQGDCGSCWAFATAGALESQVAMSTSSLVNLAEQALVSCGGSSVGNCNGGYPDSASDFIRDTGLPLEACFPYTQLNTSCGAAACPSWKTDGTYGITGWHWVATYNPTTDGIKAALNAYGPLVTTMDVYDDFYNYKSGIYKVVSKTYEGGHAVVIVGYDDTNQCFIVKNSWGTGWGESGYFRIAYGQIGSRVYFGWYTIAYEGFKSISPTTPTTPTVCSYTVPRTSRTVSASGKTITINVTTNSGCDWTTNSKASWIRYVSQTATSGSGAVYYSVRPNRTGVTRVGVVKAAGKRIVITQPPY